MSKSLDDEVNRLLAGRVGTAVAPLRSAAPSGPELIGLPMNCSVHVLPFVVVNEQDGEWLRMLRSEVPQAVAGGGHFAGPVVSAESLGSFRFDWRSWPGCPHCGTRENPAHDAAGFWLCTSCGSFNCVGADRRGRFTCRCGRIVTGSFSRQAFFDVSGSRIAAATSPVPSMPPARASSAAALPRPSAAPAAPWECGFASRPPPPAVRRIAPPSAAPSSGPRLTWKR